MAKAPNPSLDTEPAEGSHEVIDHELAKQDEKQPGKGGSSQQNQRSESGKQSSGR